MPDLPTIVPVASAIALFGASRLLGVQARYSAILRESAARQSAERAFGFVQRPRRYLSPALAAMWGLFAACDAILMVEDPSYAIALLITAASSCTLRRVRHARGRDALVQ
jgi:hypothetical protein